MGGRKSQKPKSLNKARVSPLIDPDEAGAFTDPPTNREWLDLLWYRFMGPSKVFIVEAMQRACRPLSPRDVSHMADDMIGLPSVAYHFKSLEKVGVIEYVGHVPRRGAVEHYYYWAPRPKPTKRASKALGGEASAAIFLEVANRMAKQSGPPFLAATGLDAATLNEYVLTQKGLVGSGGNPDGEVQGARRLIEVGYHLAAVLNDPPLSW